MNKAIPLGERIVAALFAKCGCQARKNFEKITKEKRKEKASAPKKLSRGTFRCLVSETEVLLTEVSVVAEIFAFKVGTFVFINEKIGF